MMVDSPDVGTTTRAPYVIVNAREFPSDDNDDLKCTCDGGGRAPAATGFGVRAVVWAVLDHWDALAGPGPRGASDGRFDGTEPN